MNVNKTTKNHPKGMEHTMFDKIPEAVNLPKGHRACRRRADELRAAHHLHRRIASYASQDHATPKRTPMAGQRQLFNVQELEEKKIWLRELTGDSQKALYRAFEKLEEAGPWRDVAKAPPPEVLDGLNADFPNFSPVTKLIQQRLCLCRVAPEKALALPPVLLNGPAGLGKTAYVQSLAGLLDIRFEKIDLSSAIASFTLTGLDAGYGNAHPGRIWESLVHDKLSVLWLLDEIDKVSRTTKDGGSEHLLGLLEPVSSKRFVDNCTLVPVDASWICYVATCNHKEQIDTPLLSRFEVFDIQAPDANQLRAIVRSIYRNIRQTEPWGQTFDAELDDEVIEALSGLTPRQARKGLFDACANAAEHSRSQLQAGDVKAKSDAEKQVARRIGFL
jgi:ATP-dependent Lon protease